ncbi:MAG: Gfo/Idh/MocA family oxidoreductase [Dehalococcoidia bacterium]|nr:Gfo/Idh/MocA family oxidoreductase [Dehalococcoidia bacterium]
MAERLRVGLIGANASAGWAARSHLPAIAGAPDVELTAVCTTRMETASEARERYGARLAFDDWRALIASDEVDAVCVSLRVPNHLEPTLAAIAAGKHVYTEWPLGRDTAEAERMAEAAREAGVHAVVGLQSRRSAELTYLRETIAAGGIGDVVSVGLTQYLAGGTERPSSRTWMADPALGASTLTIQFGHAIDGVMWAAGAIESLRANLSTESPQWFEMDTGRTVEVASPDSVALTGRLRSGALLTAHVHSVPWHGTGHRVVVYGREGALVLEQPRGATGPHTGAATVYRAGRNDDALEPVVISQEAWVSEAGLTGAAVNVAKAWQAFAAGVASGEQAAPTFDDAVVHHRLMDAVRRSAETGAPEEAG